jgi:hypothetical protein
MTEPRLRRPWRLVSIGGGIVAAVVIVVAVVAGHSSANQPPPQGVSAGVSSLERLPAETVLPPPVARYVDYVSRLRATDPAQAKARVRKLRSHLGATNADLYAFRTSGGSTCFILVGEVGLCPKRATDGSPGLQWTIGGGYPGMPSNLVGIASDDVVRVELAVDGRNVPMSLRNNAVFGEYPSSAKHAVITVHRRDGSQSSIQVHLEAQS